MLIVKETSITIWIETKLLTHSSSGLPSLLPEQWHVSRMCVTAPETSTCECTPVQVCLLESIQSVQLRPASTSPHKTTARLEQSQLSELHTDDMCSVRYTAFSWKAATRGDPCLFNP